MSGGPIPFNRSSIEGLELDHIRAAVGTGRSAAKGPYSRRAADVLRDEIGAEEVFLTTSCTAALELSAMLLDPQPGDNVIVPSFTFVTTALAFARLGFELRFADIDPTNLGMDPQSAADIADDRTRAVVPVHYAGIGMEIGKLCTWASQHDIAVIEDNAHGLFGYAADKPLGSFGRMSTLSFHETKNFVCGEGGALVINNPADVDRAHICFDKGTNRRAFLSGQVDKYTWVDVGSSFGLSDLLAAYLLGQLEQREAILAKRQHIHDRYQSALAPLADELGIVVPTTPVDRTSAYHMSYILISDRLRRDSVLKSMNDDGIQSTFHYIPLHDSAGAKPFTTRDYDCPVTTDISGRLLRLPFFNSLQEHELDRVIESLVAALRAA